MRRMGRMEMRAGDWLLAGIGAAVVVLGCSGCQVAYHKEHGLHASAFSSGSYEQGPSGMRGSYDQSKATETAGKMFGVAKWAGVAKKGIEAGADVIGEGVVEGAVE